MFNNTTHLNVGVLLVHDRVQLADIAAVDIINHVSSLYFEILPKKAEVLGVLTTPMNFHYITEDGAGPITISAAAKVAVTVRFQASFKVYTSDRDSLALDPERAEA